MKACIAKEKMPYFLILNLLLNIVYLEGFRLFSDFQIKPQTFKINKLTNEIFLGATSSLHQLSVNGSVIRSYNYLSEKCIATHSNTTTDRTSQHAVNLIVLDYTNNKILSCTQANCYSHDLENICNNVNKLPNKNLTADVGFHIPSQNKFGLARSPKPGVSSIEFLEWTDNFSKLDLAYANLSRTIKGSFSHMFVDEKYMPSKKFPVPVYYDFGFNRGGYSYFLSTSLKSPKKKKQKYVVNIARVCDKDQIMTSYVETELKCAFDDKISKNDNFVVLDAQLVNSTNGILYERPNNRYELYVVVLFGKTKKLPSSSSFAGANRSLCAFRLSEIDENLNRAVKLCNGIAYTPKKVKNKMWIFKSALGDYCINPETKFIYTLCPKIGSTNDIQVIYSSEAVETDYLWEYSGYMNDNQTSFTSFTNIQRKKDIIQVYGTENGKLYLHSHRHHDNMGYVPIVSLNDNKTVKKLEYDASNDLLIALTENDLHLVKFEEFCMSADSCVSCLSRKTLGCGFCSETSQCVFNSTCKSSSWSDSVCVSKVQSIQTTLFPKDGTTSFKLYGSDLGCLMPKEFEKKIKIIGTNSSSRKDNIVASCDLKGGLNQGDLNCTSVHQSQIFTTSLSMNSTQECELGYTVKTVINTENLNMSFVQVSVSDYGPKYGSVNGGAVVSIHGKFLDAGLEVVVKISGTECNVFERRETLLTCIMQPQDESSDKKESFVDIDGSKTLFQAGFDFLPAPELMLSADGLNGMFRFYMFIIFINFVKSFYFLYH